jgi:signal transduction histidine kinase
MAMAKGATSLEIKNISAAELNIPADELMERFQRGDESRATEGSGLGLSIARDLTRLMGGRFDITIDGDLFKATVILASQTQE